MNPELQSALQDCISVTGHLLKLMDEDRNEFPYCFRGDFLPVYQDGLARAREEALIMRRDLSVLLDRAYRDS